MVINIYKTRPDLFSILNFWILTKYFVSTMTRFYFFIDIINDLKSKFESNLTCCFPTIYPSSLKFTSLAKSTTAIFYFHIRPHIEIDYRLIGRSYTFNELDFSRQFFTALFWLLLKFFLLRISLNHNLSCIVCRLY